MVDEATKVGVVQQVGDVVAVAVGVCHAGVGRAERDDLVTSDPVRGQSGRHRLGPDAHLEGLSQQGVAAPADPPGHWRGSHVEERHRQLGGSGLVCGAIVGFAGGGGVLGAVDRGLIVGVSWALFGLGAGALHGLWAGRAISARRLKRVGAFVGPDTSLVVAWAGQDTTDDTIVRWTASATERCVLRFNSIGPGVQLEVRDDESPSQHSM